MRLIHRKGRSMKFEPLFVTYKTKNFQLTNTIYLFKQNPYKPNGFGSDIFLPPSLIKYYQIRLVFKCYTEKIH